MFEPDNDILVKLLEEYDRKVIRISERIGVGIFSFFIKLVSFVYRGMNTKD